MILLFTFLLFPISKTLYRKWKTDEKIRELVDKNYTTIVVSNEVASFSEDIIKKYNRIENVNIIIAPGHNKDNYT